MWLFIMVLFVYPSISKDTLLSTRLSAKNKPYHFFKDFNVPSTTWDNFRRLHKSGSQKPALVIYSFKGCFPCDHLARNLNRSNVFWSMVHDYVFIYIDITQPTSRRDPRLGPELNHGPRIKFFYPNLTEAIAYQFNDPDTHDPFTEVPSRMRELLLETKEHNSNTNDL